MATRPRDPIRLLIIEDDQDACETIRALLRDRLENVPDVDCVRSAEKGLALLDERGHDVYVIGHGLDRAGGGALLQSLVAANHAPVVLLNGRRDAQTERDILGSGAADFIWKEELSGPLVERVLRHALEARDHARLERPLHLAQRMETVGQLAGGIAHEFNNILTAIVGFGTLLAEHVAADEEASAQVREILDGAARATTLTRDLLAFSRRQVLRPTRIDLADVVQNLTRMLRGVLGSHIELQVRCAEGLPVICADRAQLEQAITTLAINARDAMPDGGRLAIELDRVVLDEGYCVDHLSMRQGPHLRLTISDTGAGIPREQLPQVFEPFFTLREPGTSAALGLSTVYGIVKQSGGNIWVYSEPGRGTTFKVYFPVHAQDAQEHSEAGGRRRERPTGAETILLVDDTEVVRRLARGVLSDAGYRVLEAGGADEALQVAGEQPTAIDLLVTDVVMPGRNGVELARRLRTSRSIVRVLYMSGYTDDGVVREGLLSDDVAFLQKPFTPADLLRKVREVLEVP